MARTSLLIFSTLLLACGAEDPLPDLAAPGPEVVQSATLEAPNGLRKVKLDCRYPLALGRPAVLIGHGFLIAPDQYDSYAEHLASHGIVACTVDFVTGLTPNHALWATDYRAALDRLIVANAEPGGPLEGRIDSTRLGLAGHSLGGKLAVLAAKEDARVKALLGIDPVDTMEPNATALLPLPIPTAYLGETIDSAAEGMACAPEGANYRAFFEASNSPTLEVTVVGANHVSFLDDRQRCELVCGFCNPATVADAEVQAVTRAYLVAFFGAYLDGRDLQPQLTGAEAEARWVNTGKVNLRSR